MTEPTGAHPTEPMTPPPATTPDNPPATHRARPITGRTRARRAARARAEVAAVFLASLVGGLAIGVTPAVASDDPTEEGLWYYTVPGLPEIHASGITGEGITVGVIDGPINPDSPDLVGTSLILPEASFCDGDRDGSPDPATSTTRAAVHATGLTAVIIGTGTGVDGQPGVQGVAPGATVRPYVRTVASAGCTLDGQDAAVLALDQAIADGVDIINLSFSGWGSKPDALAALARAQQAGIIVVAASNNEGGTELGWPALANGVVAVEAADVHGALHPTAVNHPQLTVVAPGVDMRVLYDRTITADWRDYLTTSGSSLATAWVSGALALAWSQYPDATANQMIQALLRTTSQSDGNLTRVDDHWGYGMVNARNLVTIDPTTLPDVNPLLLDDPDAQPTIDQIMGTEPEPEPTPEPTTEPDPEPTQTAPAPTDPTSTGLTPVVILLVVAALVLAGAITTVILTRRHTTTATTATTPVPPPGPPPGPPGPPPSGPPTTPTPGG